MYLSFNEYLEMGGNLADTAFFRFAFGAEQTVRRATFGRVDRMKEVPKAVKWLVFELVGRAWQKEEGTARVASESVGSWSRSYQAQTAEEGRADTDALIRDYLAMETDDNGIPLLYLGVDA